MKEPELLDALQRSMAALRSVKERVKELEGAARDPIAVVGMGCRFAGGVSTPDALWELLDRGVDAIGPVPRDRWDADALYDADPAVAGKSIARAGGFLAEDVFGFDAEFFGITPREAFGMDPQQRLLLEVAWDALENACIVPESLMASQAGVFVATNLQEYAALHHELSDLDGYALTGAHPSVASGRISYVLGAKGPSVTVDTACSSSLVAVHLACQSLRGGECDVALAGGSGLMLAPTVFVEFSRLRGLAANGRCKTFDASADGMGWGEGCGVVVLKRLSSALAAGDRVLAVLRGSAVNQDGRSNGLTAPNGPSQQQVIAQALRRAGVEPAEVAYVEAHGAGTPLGDPIEMLALGEVLAEGRAPTNPLLVGSVKTNIGHTMAAAGLAGLIKTILALRHGRIPANLHFTTPSSHIPWESLPVKVPTESTPWPAGSKRRIAGVSSFGVSGTNAHVVVEEAPSVPPVATAHAPADRAAHLLLVSARTPDALAQQAERYADSLESGHGARFADVCHTAATGRTHFEERLVVVAGSANEARERLMTAARGETAPGCVGGRAPAGRRPKVAFLFTGQGSQYTGMGRDLYDVEPVFRSALDRCAEILQPLLERPLLSVIYPRDGESSPLDETRYTQPALFALEYALFELWRSWGIVPDVVMGHSVGEVSAACAAGVLSLEDGLALIAARGRLMHALPPDGEMASLKIDATRLSEILSTLASDVSIGGYNGPESVVISGRRESVRAVCRELESRGIKTKTLNIAIASHSSLMEPMLGELERIAGELSFHAPRIPLVTNLTGEVAGAEVTTAAHWRALVRQPVQFEPGMRTLRALGVDVFVEIGPQPTLLGMGAGCLPGDQYAWLPSLKKDHPTWTMLLESVARLHVKGAALDWRAFDAPFGRAHTVLPTYAFQRRSYRADRSRTDLVTERAKSGEFALSGTGMSVPGEAIHRVLRLGSGRQPYLADHLIQGRVAVPGSFHIAALIAVAVDVFGAKHVMIRDLQFLRPLAVEKDTTLHFVLTPASDGELAIRICTPLQSGSEWCDHVRGTLVLGGAAPTSTFAIAAVKTECPSIHAVDAMFDRLREMNIEMGPGWRWIDEAFTGAGASLVRASVRDDASRAEAPVHPVLLDNCLAAGVLASPARSTPQGDLHLLWSVKELRWYGAASDTVWSRARHRSESGDVRTADLAIVGGSGQLVMELDDVAFKRADPSAFAHVSERDSDSVFELNWPVREPTASAVPPARWIVIASDPDRGARLSRRLASGGAAVSVAQAGDGLEGYLRAALTSGPVDGIVSWWSSEGADDAAAGAEATAVEALATLRTILRAAESGAPRLWLVTEGAQAVTPSDDVALDLTPIWGLGRALVQESPKLQCSLVDLERGNVDAAIDALSGALGRADDETEIAFRSGARHVARLVKGRAGAGATALMDPDATILITGGLGGLGLRVAEHFIDRGARHVILTGRSAPSQERARRIEDLRSKAEVTVVQADVSRAADVERVLSAIPHHRPLRGIVHAAGVVEGDALVDLDAERLRRVLRPKVVGAWNLHEQTKAMKLDFFVLFSSIQSIVGSATQGNYAAANAFLDGLAHRRRKAGLVAQSLNWGAWSGDGMAASLREEERVRLARVGFGMLTPEQGMGLFARALRRPEAQLMLAQIDLAAIQKAASSDDVAPVLRALVRPSIAKRTGAPRGAALRERLLGLSPAERERAVQDVVRAEAAAAMRLPGPAAVPLDQPLKQLGLDSLMALEIPNRLKAAAGEAMPATLLYDHPTVRAVASFVLRKLSLAPEGQQNQTTIVTPEKKSRLTVEREEADQTIAIVAMACRAPGGVDTPEALWALLERGESAISMPPGRRAWNVAELHDPDPDRDGKAYSLLGGFLEDADEFDAAFFELNEREATLMDPQQRLLLEVSWEALERAGIPSSSFAGSRTGVFVGLMENAYGAALRGTPAAHERATSLGSRASVASARIAYALGLRGPALSIDTACSSSLVSMHLACQSLRAGECDMALAGGVTVMVNPGLFVESSRQRALAADGRCKPFSDAADGIVWAEGAGMLVLERLADARRNGHPVVAVLRGSAVNHDGRGQGLTAPNGAAQQEVVTAALRASGLDAGEIDVVEAHGTGTPVGDSIEATALLETYGRAHTAERPLRVGNMKPLIGHAQAAAGVLGVIKTVLSMQHARIPAMGPFGAPSRHVDWTGGTLRLLAAAESWTKDRHPRRASVSAFGVGTNAHVVLEEGPAPDLRSSADAPGGEVALLVSGRTEAALRAQARSLALHLEHGSESLFDVAWTAAQHKTSFAHRAAIVACDRAHAVSALYAVAEGRPAPGVVRGIDRESARVVFVVTGRSETVDRSIATLAAWGVRPSATLDASATATIGAAIQELEDGSTVFLSLGPKGGSPSLSVHLRKGSVWIEGAGETASLQLAVAALSVHGISCDWPAVWSRRGRFVPTPTYAFQRSRFWVHKSLARSVDVLESPLFAPSDARLQSSADRPRFLLDLVRGEVAAVLGSPDPDAIPADGSLFRLGIDSLRATSLRNRLKARTGASLPATLVFDNPTITAIASLLEQALTSEKASPVARAPQARDTSESSDANPSARSYEEFDL